MLSILRRLMKNEKGATAIEPSRRRDVVLSSNHRAEEYTLIAALIAAAAIAGVGAIGGTVSNLLGSAMR